MNQEEIVQPDLPKQEVNVVPGSDYVTPQLVVLGSLKEVTQASGGGGTDFLDGIEPT